MRHGSLQNMIAADSKGKAPEVGMGVTEILWTDRRPWTVVAVKSPTRIIVQMDSAEPVTGRGAVGHNEWTITPDPTGHMETLTLRKDGKWRRMGDATVFLIGIREKHHDWSF